MDMLSSVIILTVTVVVTVGECRKKKLHLHEPEVMTYQILPKERWFVQKLNHFKPSDDRIWHQRYYVNETFYNTSKDSPVFLMIGGEGEASPKWMVTGAWMEYAEEFGAQCFMLEHRYYGMSRPTINMSTENLQYLNSVQVLADLAFFVSSMNNRYHFTSKNKWIVFGGSYSGTLAAWFRYKYPHLVHAAVSSSGPLLAKADFREYFKVVGYSLSTFGPDCALQVQLANQAFTQLLTDPNGGKILTKKFRLCRPIKIKNKKDHSNLAETLADNIAEVVQYNMVNRNPSSKLTIEHICTIMVNESIGAPLDRYAAINVMMMKLRHMSCRHYEYSDDVKFLQNTTWDYQSDIGDRQWFYQTCVEFGFYQTSTTDDELFGPNFPLHFFTQECSDVYGRGYNEAMLRAGVNLTNTMYGDVRLRGSRVVFVHGSIDPWHALGLTSATSSLPVVFIQGTAHCADVYSSKATDPPQLKAARTQIKHYIKEWLAVSE